MDGEHNMVNYFTRHHPTSHHWAQRSTYLVPTEDTSKYTLCMSPNEIKGCVEPLPARVNGRRTDKVSLLPGR